MADDELNGSDIYRLMNAGPSKTATLDAARDTAHDLSAGHDEIANDIKDLQTEINNYWEGESAEAAKRSFGPIIESSDLAAAHLNDNRQALESQSREFYATLRALDEMEGEEPSRSVGDWISPWQTDHENAIGVWVKNNTHNIEKYSEYTGTSSSNEGKMPQAFPELDEGGKAAMQTSSAGPDIGSTQSGPQVGSPSGGGTSPGAGGTYAAPMAAGPRVSSPSGTRSGSGVGGSPVRPGSYVPPSTPTVPAGYTAPAASTGSRPFNDPAAAFGPLGTSRDTEDTRGRGVPGATGGGVGPGSRSGIGPGGRPLAGGAPGGPGSGQGLSGGRMSGVAPGGAAGAAGGPGAAGGAAAGRGGAGMMGPMGAGAGGRGEDQEHQRKYIQDSDEWFKPERDEDGDVMRDPTTGFVVLPPGGVIGE